MEKEIIDVVCWNCGKMFKAPLDNYYAGELFCCDECRLESIKKDLKRKQEREAHGYSF